MTNPNIVNTRTKLVEYIRMMLGEPQIKVELNDIQISFIIDTTIQKYTEFAMSGQLERASLIELTGTETEIQLTDDTAYVLGVYSSEMSGAGLVSFIGSGSNETLAYSASYAIVNNASSNSSLNEYIIAMTKFSSYMYQFSNNVNYDWNENSKILKFLDNNAHGKKYLVHIMKAYIPRDLIDVTKTDLIYNNSWVKAYALALTQLKWGQLLGKYSNNLIGGAQINYDRIISEAKEDIEKLENDLYEKYTAPLGVVVD